MKAPSSGRGLSVSKERRTHIVLVVVIEGVMMKENDITFRIIPFSRLGMVSVRSQPFETLKPPPFCFCSKRKIRRASAFFSIVGVPV
ncbi:hypothetical protein TNCV_1053951 [Trichonephila clavipes]|nr:hypothetical protein TNCV_1053951 [Trichonephila clavipes]